MFTCLLLCFLNFQKDILQITQVILPELIDVLSKSESVKFSLIESVIFLFTDSSVKNIFH